MAKRLSPKDKRRKNFRAFLEENCPRNVEELYACCDDAGLINFVRQTTSEEISSLFDIERWTICKEIRGKLKLNNVLRNNSLYSQTLKHYANFLDSTIYNKQPGAKRPKTKPAKEQTEKADKPEIELKSLSEGAQKHVEYESKYRNPELRKRCIAEYGFVCQVCGFDFAKAYGELGEGFIEVHHLEPISTFETEHKVDPLRDLVPLCSNCHSMIHHGKGEVLTLKQLRDIYQGKKWEISKIKDG